MTLCTLSLLATLIFSPHNPTANPAKDLDFWVGNWRCEGQMTAANGQKTQTSATNHVVRILDGHIIQENFRMKGLNGMSVSTYDPRMKMWRQTWVDNGGGYIALQGNFADGQMTLTTQTIPDGSVKRMVYSDITPKSFDWDWQGSQDGGKTWTTQWHLHYTRVVSK